MKLPIGISDFKKVTHYDFVDKSLFIREVVNDAEVILITRPRRFGKTLNMSMLQYFFAAQVNGQSTKDLFKNLNIAKETEFYEQHQGKYPVIFISFKEVKSLDFVAAKSKIAEELRKIYETFRYLETSISPEQREIYTRILRSQATDIDLQNALYNLSQYLYQYHKVSPYLLIDEYDTPIQSAYHHNYYQEMVYFIRSLLDACLKDNPYLSKAVLTGILRVSKESLFSGLNNLAVYTILHPKYGPYFGFTEAEVLPLLKKAKLENHALQIKNWYNGYVLGESIVYNPWSIIYCIQEKGLLKPYWVNTSDNALIQSLFEKSSILFKDQLEALLKGGAVEQLLDENFVYSDLKNGGDFAIWNLLLMTGYLKSVHVQETIQGTLCQLAIPNEEIRSLYRKIIEQWISQGYGVIWYNHFINNLLEGNIKAFEQNLLQIMEQTISVYDMANEPEAFYHGLMIGLTASLHEHENYELRSNRESGYGRYDYLILSRDPGKFTIILELKKIKLAEGQKSVEENFIMLQNAASSALTQINDQSYLSEIKQRNLTKVVKVGIAFCGKRFALAYDLTT